MSGAPQPEPEVAAMLAALALRHGHAADDRPRVLLNMISSVDGRASLHGRSGGLSGTADRQFLLGLREGVDAVLVGAGTARAERYGRMLRDAATRERRRHTGLSAEPLACIVSGTLDIPEDLPLLATSGADVVVLTATTAELGPCAARVRYIREGRFGRLDLPRALGELTREFGVRTVVCEGGPTLNRSLIALGLVDELLLTVAPALVGGRDPLTIISGDELEPARLELVSATPVGSYLFLRYRATAALAAGG